MLLFILDVTFYSRCILGTLPIWECISGLFIHSTNNFEYHPHFRIFLGVRHTEISNDPGVNELTEIDE